MLLTADQVAKQLAVSAKTVWRLVDAGKLDAVRLTPSRRGWRFTEAAVQRAIVALEQPSCRPESAGTVTRLTYSSTTAELDKLLAPKRLRQR